MMPFGAIYKSVNATFQALAGTRPDYENDQVNPNEHTSQLSMPARPLAEDLHYEISDYRLNSIPNPDNSDFSEILNADREVASISRSLVANHNMTYNHRYFENSNDQNSNSFKAIVALAGLGPASGLLLVRFLEPYREISYPLIALAVIGIAASISSSLSFFRRQI